jgi:hypothetical protein
VSEALFSSLQERFGLASEAATRDEKTAAAIYAALFKKQQQVLDDTSRRKAILCPRRAGKSWTALSYAFHTCLTKPFANCLIVGLTLKSLKGIYWERVLPLFEQNFGITTRKHHTEMKVKFPNGSLLTFTGAESKAEIDKLRGQAYDIVILDECKSFSPSVLDELIQDVFRRALMDRKGTICMIGTPGAVLDGPFYEGTYPGACDAKGRLYSRSFDTPEQYWTQNPRDRSWRWSRHFWSIKENSALPHAWEEALRDKEEEGWDDDNPVWLREYLGQWVSSDDVFVYAYAGLVETCPEKVRWRPAVTRENKHGLPPDADYRFVVGIDLGFEDDFAIVVGAYSLTDGNLYHVYDLKLKHQDVYEIERHVVRVLERFENKVDAIVADNAGLGKMVIETLNRRGGLNIQPAEKREKYDFIELLNGDFRTGRVKVIEDSDLDMELRTLQWDLTKHTKVELIRTGKLREHPGMPNHLSDALLYLWRYSYHTYGKPASASIQHGTPEWFARWEQRSIEQMYQRAGRSEIDAVFSDSPDADPLEPYYGERYYRSSRD